MKLLLRILTIAFLTITFIQTSNAWVWSDIINWSKPKINVDCANSDCSLTKWTELVKDTINDIEKDKTFSEYIQDIIFYVITFVSFIALIYIIFAWFKVLTSWWDEEENKKAKWIIKAVIIWIAIIWLAYPITSFIIKALTATST